MRFRLRTLSITIFGSLGCTTAAERTAQHSTTGSKAADTVAADTVAADTVAAVTVAAGTVAADSLPAPSVVRALYVNRWASQSRKRMAKLIATADSTEINALVIDMKDEFGLNY
ncbi:MAG TPA: putative glycoside hydrolase, partial [Gemmatimonadaceae bacterium]|nr:putative glycoside hydrolase [Gemmatimonadaceae bacterium]